MSQGHCTGMQDPRGRESFSDIPLRLLGMLI